MAFGNTHTDILLAGAFAAFSVDLLVYPLDTIKTRIQSPDYKRLYTNTANGTVNRALFRGLYQGIGSVILATVPSSGAFFTTYESTKSLLQSTPIPSPITNSLASSSGELVSCFILTPAEVLKQNAQMVSKPPPHSGPSPNPTKIFDTNATAIAFRKFSNKPSQLWRGYTALAGRNLPFTAMHFPLFEHLRSMIRTHRRDHGTATGTISENALITAVSAGAAGSVAAVLTTPIDVVKTRIMLSASQSRTEPNPEPLNRDAKSQIERARAAARGGRAGGWAVGREVWRSEGLRGLFRGGALRGAWTAIGSGLYLGAYESGRAWLEGRRAGNNNGEAL